MKNLATIILVFFSLKVNSQSFTSKDSAMVAEINNLRTNPQSYIPLVQEYVKLRQALLKNNPLLLKKEAIAADELVKLLKTLPSLSVLSINKDMFNITKDHTEYLVSINNITHASIDGKSSSERFKHLKFSSVSENVGKINKYLYEKGDFKTILLELLIDTCSEGRGHRCNLLNSYNKFISVHISNGYYVQDFAF